MQTATVYTGIEDSAEAGRDLGAQVRAAIGAKPPDAVVVFASSRFDYGVLLSALHDACLPAILVGSSSAGEFTGLGRGVGTACALAFRSKDIRAAAGLGLGVSVDRDTAARNMIAGFRGLDTREFPYRSALILTDALAGHADALVEQLTVLTSGKYQFAGGGAGDDAQFSRTHVFFGTEAFTDAVVALELLSTKPLGVGVGHGWVVSGPALRVTEAEGMRLVSLNGMPAVAAFTEHAAATTQPFDAQAPLPFFLHNILGIRDDGNYRLRVPLAVNDDGSVALAAEVPSGSIVHIMKSTDRSAIMAAEQATRSAISALNGATPHAALVFDCVATRLRLGHAFDDELRACAEMLHPAKFVGCNTYGQIARAEGQFGGFHNCTAVVCVLPA